MLVPKICGIKDINTLKYIISHEHYPKLVGMILNYEKSPRLISINKAKELTNLKGSCEYVGVLTSPISLDLLESIKDLNFSYYQIYNQTPEQIKNIKDQYNKKIILALTIKTAEDINQYKQYENILSPDDILLFDSKGYAETKSFDHSLLKKVQKDIKNKIMIAGGIKIDDNFNEIASFCDYVDLSGNLESKKGVKDFKKIDIFLKNINNLK